MAKWGELNCPNCADLEDKLRKSALQELSALGQASEAYQAQLAAEAKLAQQDDLVQALVAAALREAALIARASFDGEIGYDEILDLITPDAQAALDRYVKGRSDDAVEKMLYHLYLADQHTNLVEKGQGDA